MPNLNKVMLIGNVTRDPELKHTQSGAAIGNLGLAINRSYKKDGGEKVEEVTFVDVEFWGRLAEIADEYVKKGNPLFIEGRLKLDQWEDIKSGQKRTKLKVVAEGLQLLGGKENAGSGSSKPAERPAPASKTLAPPQDDDIPF